MPRQPPNILWIVTTQWRAQACGFAGDPNARTPHLDALAAQGVSFTEAVTPHPFGPFARAALLTGVPSPQNGVRDYYDPLPENAVTIAHALRARGYATAFFGKWHLGKRDPTAPLVGEAHAKTIVPPVARGGFEVWDGFESGFVLNGPWFHGRTSEMPQRVTGYQSDVVCTRAAEHIAAGTEGGQPWFVVASMEAPHPPYDAAASGIAPRPPSEIVLRTNVPRGGDVEARARRELAGYYAHIEATDRAIGQILLPKADANTVIVFTSVHGDMHGAHGLFRKGWPHEESVRVPLIVRMPVDGERRDAKGFSTALVSLLDLPQWTLGWAAGERSACGRVLAEAEGGQQISMPSIVALPWQCDRAWRGLRTAAHKLVVQDNGVPWQFFQLDRDPQEMLNRVADPAAAAMAELATRLTAAASSPVPLRRDASDG